ncbi:EAL domain-containing response regulator [Shewanella sp. OMA3-2]|uniref:EAL domain-containing response regulator n=1 Tax=Shewanella sp. OMA3-2 TaxID=2908650 RepID=UPI001F3709EE|nr:EAL domain-containing protein [Shewanella sp. OMA3-2]UJF20869.1 EAL domain-containing protein [Shewanella sp. OMA3-2]
MMGRSTESYIFLAESDCNQEQIEQLNKTWKILSVEDDLDYQRALVSSLESLILPNRTRLQILTANSAFEASTILNTHSDIGLILLDVVMEEDDAGLRLISTIREDLGNALVRIVLVTGQPGFAPEKDVMYALDIDEYWNKADLKLDKLHSIVSSNFRTWNYISELAEASQSLQIVLDAARSISNRYELSTFTRTVLAEIANIIGANEGGLICMGNNLNLIKDAHVVTATGCFEKLKGLTISDEHLNEIYADLQQALNQKRHVITRLRSVLYFETKDVNEKCYLIVVSSSKPLTDAHINLLKVFSENISSGFTNIALLNRVTELAYTHSDLNIPNRNWLKKEIQNMSSLEWKKTRLIMLEVKYYDEMKFTFGYEFTQSVLIYVHKVLHEILPISTRVTLSGHKQFSILLDINFELTPELIHKLTCNEIEVDGVAHISSFTLLDMPLDTLDQSSAIKIISMAESELKQASLNNIAYIQHSQHETDLINRRYGLMGELRASIRERKLSVMLQPKVCLFSGEIVGFESLARWQRDDGSFVPPDEFIPIAEAAGLIIKLDCLIFEKTMEALNTLVDMGYRVPIAFNASSFDLLHPDYFNFISNCITRYGLPSELLELEVTESQAIADYDRIQESLQRFVVLGIKISIDDFGTGYSSLAHISHITAHSIKIDRSFVSQLEVDENSEHVINMILKLGKKFNFSIVAEGIETEYQKMWLKNAGCDIAQGYLFSKPLAIQDLIQWLAAYRK